MAAAELMSVASERSRGVSTTASRLLVTDLVLDDDLLGVNIHDYALSYICGVCVVMNYTICWCMSQLVALLV